MLYHPKHVPHSFSSSDITEVDYDRVYAGSVDSELFDTYYSASGNIELRSKSDHIFQNPSPKQTFSNFFTAIPDPETCRKLLPLMLVLERQQSKTCFEGKLTAFFRWKRNALRIVNGMDLSDNLQILRRLADSHLITDEELEEKHKLKTYNSINIICSILGKMHDRNRIQRSNFAKELFNHWKKVSVNIDQVTKSLPLFLRMFCLLEYVKKTFFFIRIPSDMFS